MGHPPTAHQHTHHQVAAPVPAIAAPASAAPTSTPAAPATAEATAQPPAAALHPTSLTLQPSHKPPALRPAAGLPATTPHTCFPTASCPCLST